MTAGWARHLGGDAIEIFSGGSSARSSTATFSGIQPSSVLPFIAVRILGAAAAVPLMRAIHPSRADDDED